MRREAVQQEVEALAGHQEADLDPAVFVVEEEEEEAVEGAEDSDPKVLASMYQNL